MLCLAICIICVCRKKHCDSCVLKNDTLLIETYVDILKAIIWEKQICNSDFHQLSIVFNCLKILLIMYDESSKGNVRVNLFSVLFKIFIVVIKTLKNAFKYIRLCRILFHSK